MNELGGKELVMFFIDRFFWQNAQILTNVYKIVYISCATE